MRPEQPNLLNPQKRDSMHGWVGKLHGAFAGPIPQGVISLTEGKGKGAFGL